MKTSLLLPLSLGLLLAGCGRTNTDSTKTSASNQPAPDKSAYDDTATIANKEATAPSQVVAATPPASTASQDAAFETLRRTADTAPIVANPAPAAATEPTAYPAPATPVAITPEPATPEPSRLAVSPTTEMPVTTDTADKIGNESKSAHAAHLAQWKLTSDEIKGEFEASGRIVRSKSSGADEPTGAMDDTLVTLVKGKLQSDAGTSALKIDVSADKGIVTLTGTAKSLEQIGTAVAIALDTDGVTQAISTIKLESAN